MDYLKGELEMKDIKFEDIDFDLKEESWIKDEENLDTEAKLNYDLSKIDRDLLSKTVLIEYIRERIKQKHQKRISVSGESEKALLRLSEDQLKQFLDLLIDELIPIVEVSLKKTIFPRHVSYAKNVISRLRL
jgi:ribosome-binding ATPase YchF (GTP1/OBG family)